jgi:hypothetical protein
MPEVPEHLLRRSAEARAKALGVPLEQVLAEMGLAAEGTTPAAVIEEVTAGVSLDTPGTTIPDDLRERETAAREKALGGVAPAAAEPAVSAPSEPAPEVEVPAAPAPVVEELAPAAAASPVAAAASESKVPEALLRRSAEAKAKATGRPVEEILSEMTGGAASAEPAAATEPTEPAPVAEEPAPAASAAPAAAAASESKIPEALLRRSAEAKAKTTGRPVEEIVAEMSGGAPPAPAPEPPPAVVEPASEPAAVAASAVEVPAATAPAPAPEAGRTTTVTAPPVVPPAGTPEGVRPQRLLTVVRAKSIQQVKAEPTDKVSVWPHLLLIEFVALLAVTSLLLVLSVILQAPLLDLANFNLTPNPSKAPWYFLGLQELLSYFDPQVGGVLVPTVVGVAGLMAIPYVDRNPSTKPSDRKFAIVFFTFFLVASATLSMIGVLFRGPGFNFSYPWSDGIWFDDLKDWISFE